MTENEELLLSLNKEILTLCKDILAEVFKEGFVLSKRLILLEEKLDSFDPAKKIKPKTKPKKRSINDQKAEYRTEIPPSEEPENNQKP
ncbi:MAG: hypothetical protein H8E51_07070 [Bacteroidetes bacterium]|nr:hypothetical protein [Bacteroidota bacterium]